MNRFGRVVLSRAAITTWWLRSLPRLRGEDWDGGAPYGGADGTSDLGYFRQTARDRRNVFETLIKPSRLPALDRSVMRCMKWVGSIGGVCSEQ